MGAGHPLYALLDLLTERVRVSGDVAAYDGWETPNKARNSRVSIYRVGVHAENPSLLATENPWGGKQRKLNNTGGRVAN